jgi:1-phosphatidylinositol-3-phosphate 5-kinase
MKVLFVFRNFSLANISLFGSMICLFLFFMFSVKIHSFLPDYFRLSLTKFLCFFPREISPVIPLSSASWSMSFAKYLDLRLHASNYHRQSPSKKCNHSLHRDHVQYFAVGQTVAAFKLSLVKLREIASPSIVITIDDSKSLSDRQDLIEMTKIVAIKGYNIFATIADYLTTCHSLELEKLEDKLATLLAAKRSEKQMFKDWLECLQVSEDTFLIRLLD